MASRNRYRQMQKVESRRDAGVGRLCSGLVESQKSKVESRRDAGVGRLCSV